MKNLISAALLVLPASGWAGMSLQEKTAAFTQAQAAVNAASGSSEALKAGNERWDGAVLRQPLSVSGGFSEPQQALPPQSGPNQGAKPEVPAPKPAPSRGSGAAIGFVSGFLVVEAVPLALMTVPIIGWLLGPALFIAVLPAALVLGGIGALIGSPF